MVTWQKAAHYHTTHGYAVEGSIPSYNLYLTTLHDISGQRTLQLTLLTDESQDKQPLQHSPRGSLYKEGLPPSLDTSSPSKDLYAFLSIYLRFLWQRCGLVCKQALRTLPPQQLHQTTCSTYRLQPIKYSRVSATCRLSKILVHTLSLALPSHPCGPGHTIFYKKNLYLEQDSF